MTAFGSPTGLSSCATPRRRTARAGALKFGPSLVSLTALIWAGQAAAQTTITADTTAPLVTSVAGNVTINAGGSIKPASGVAVTIDSNNTLTNGGLIQFRDKNDVTGVLVLGGRTTTITNTGTIQENSTSSNTEIHLGNQTV
ncbi:MAG TPA: hypothetical protein VGC92_05870, partial [Phenylobacterium sp.]